MIFFFFSSRRRHTRWTGDWSSDVCSSDLAETFAKLPAVRQEELIAAYYGRDRGIGYSLGRTNINSCDFSSDMYTYVTEGDSALSSFSIAHALRYKIPLIKRARAGSGNTVKGFARPWSPPGFREYTNNMV